jgi:hypothetical protein
MRLKWMLLMFSAGVGFALGILGTRLDRDARTFAADDPVKPVKPDSDDLNPAVNETDRFVWEVFVKINAAAKNGTNDTIWETWANDDDTFPAKPDLKKPPEWPGGAPRKKALQQSHQQLIRRKLLEGSPHHQLLHEMGREAPVLPHIIAGGGEEVRRNKPDFEFIVKNNLWYLEGLQAAFKKGDPISFPLAAIEVKAQWKPITENDKPRYHWNVDSNNKLFGLIALHIMTKDLPNWVWATWEQVDNPDRCKILECHDSFGVTKNDKISPALKALFKQAGMGPEWENYRLDGAQIDFTDSTGRPTLLGNSIIEAGFVATSSCITCHARATFDASGRPLPIFRPDGQSYNGTPDPNWYYTTTNPPKPLYLQGDFVWSFFLASPAQPSQ